MTLFSEAIERHNTQAQVYSERGMKTLDSVSAAQFAHDRAHELLCISEEH
jgi:hypothetical protein